MTWLELIEHLRKQPLYLLEEQVAIGCVLLGCNNEELDCVTCGIDEIVSPITDGSFKEWLVDPSLHLRINVEVPLNVDHI